MLPRWRPQYGWPWLGSSADYFSVEKLHELCQAITIDEFEARRPTAGVHLCRIFLEYNPTWSDPQGFELYPALKSLLVDLEYFAEIGLEHASDERISLARPLRGSREVAAQFARIDAPVLALDHAFNVVALPSVLDAGERQILLGALRPCERLRRRLSDFTAAIERPCLAAHVRRTDHWRLAKLMGDERFWPGIDDFVRQIEATMRDRRLRAWVLATDCDDAAELEVLQGAAGHVPCDALTAGEDGVAAAVLHMWLCIGADMFVGTRGSMYSDYIEKFRVADGKTVDHAFFAPPTPAAAAPAAAPAAAEAAGTLAAVLEQRERAQQQGAEERAAALAAAAAGGAARQGALLGLMAHKLPPELRARVLSFHPEAAAMPAVLCKSARELFDAFIVEQLPRLRAAAGPLAVAAPGSTDRVALLIEPRCHPALEHVVRNAMHFLGEGWQLQIFHGTENEAFLREIFSADELRDVQLVSLEVDNLSPLAHNELMCTHWLWQRAAAEHVLIFQTDALLLRRGVDDFLRWDYIGAPWRTDDLWCVGKPHLMEAGNGGLSLRSRARALETLDRFGAQPWAVGGRLLR